jgi:hypothetical protein
MVPTAPSVSTCDIRVVEGYVRGSVRPDHMSGVQWCYHEWARACVSRDVRGGLLVGLSDGDAFVHLAARDAIASMALAGLPAGFRIAVVALSAALIAIYDAVVVEATRRGIEARRFQDEASAVEWLKGRPAAPARP